MQNEKLHFQMTFSLPSTSCLRKLPNKATKEIRWTKDGVPVNTRASISSIRNNSTLVIEKVLTSDSGKYSCKAVNKAGSASSSVDIRVTGNKDR